ncbi:MAG: type II toxin-antitoxin system HicA family toxin [Mycobacteriales bacterium]
MRALERHGWELARVRGSHYIMKNSVERRTIPVPMHNRGLRTGTLRGILRQIDLSVDELRRLL